MENLIPPLGYRSRYPAQPYYQPSTDDRQIATPRDAASLGERRVIIAERKDEKPVVVRI